MTCMEFAELRTVWQCWTREISSRSVRSQKLGRARTMSLADSHRGQAMSTRYFVVGLFIIAGLALFALGIFLVGNRHEAFSRHLNLYTQFTDLNCLTTGVKV